jgi:hypothetical protein
MNEVTSKDGSKQIWGKLIQVKSSDGLIYAFLLNLAGNKAVIFFEEIDEKLIDDSNKFETYTFSNKKTFYFDTFMKKLQKLFL